MNIRPISKIITANNVIEGRVTVYCSPTGQTNTTDLRAKQNAVDLGSVGDKYKERFTQENPAN